MASRTFSNSYITDITASTTFNEEVGTWTYVKCKDNIVYVNYQGEAIAHTADTILAVIPSGYRPKNTVTAPFNYASNDTHGMVSIATNGNIMVRTISSTTASGRICFNVSYPLG